MSGSDIPAISLATHPRASGAIARARSLGGLLGAALVGLLAHRSGLPVDTCLARALLGGVVGLLSGWAIAIAVWKQLVRAEIHAEIERRTGWPGA